MIRNPEKFPFFLTFCQRVVIQLPRRQGFLLFQQEVPVRTIATRVVQNYEPSEWFRHRESFRCLIDGSKGIDIMTRARVNPHVITVLASVMLLAAAGCTANYRMYRTEGAKHFSEGRFAAARGLFAEAYQMVPENVDNLYDLACCHRAMGLDALVRGDRPAAIREFERAITWYNRALQSYPGDERSIAGLNDTLELRGRHTEALQTAEWASTMIGPSARQQLYLADEYAQRGDADRALVTYKQAVAMEPANPTPYWALGRFYLKLGRRDDAVASLQQAYRLDPTRTAIADEIRHLGGQVPDVSAIDTSG
jgi:protein O-GlcNAc transferase